MEKKIELLKRKYIDGECRHICIICKHREKCWKELGMYNVKVQSRGYGRTAYTNSIKTMTELSLLDQVKKLQADKKEMRQEIERLHGIIQQLTIELDEAEEHAYAMQEKLSQLIEQVRL